MCYLLERILKRNILAIKMTGCPRKESLSVWVTFYLTRPNRGSVKQRYSNFVQFNTFKYFHLYSFIRFAEFPRKPNYYNVYQRFRLYLVKRREMTMAYFWTLLKWAIFFGGAIVKLGSRLKSNHQIKLDVSNSLIHTVPLHQWLSPFTYTIVYFASSSFLQEEIVHLDGVKAFNRGC